MHLNDVVAMSWFKIYMYMYMYMGLILLLELLSVCDEKEGAEGNVKPTYLTYGPMVPVRFNTYHVVVCPKFDKCLLQVL